VIERGGLTTTIVAVPNRASAVDVAAELVDVSTVRMTVLRMALAPSATLSATGLAAPLARRAARPPCARCSSRLRKELTTLPRRFTDPIRTSQPCKRREKDA
jgi:hypothetical protein